MVGIEAEIVRLVKEIGAHEELLMDYRRSEADAFSTHSKKQYLQQAEIQRQTIERKMNLLTILKG